MRPPSNPCNNPTGFSGIPQPTSHPPLVIHNSDAFCIISYPHFPKTPRCDEEIRYGYAMAYHMTHIGPYQPTTAMGGGDLASGPPSSMRDRLSQIKWDTVRRCAEATLQTDRTLLFGMTTALKLHSIPIPENTDLDETQLHVVVASAQQRIRLVGTNILTHVWHHADTAPFTSVYPSVRAIHPFHVWAQMTTHLSFESLITLGDSIITSLAEDSNSASGSGNVDGNAPAEITRRNLASFIGEMPAFSGKRDCIAAAALTAANVDSPMETKCRLAILAHGLPPCETGYIVPGMAFRSGAPIRLDMAWPQWKIAIEYDGDHHRTDKRQWRWDQEKRERLRSRGWIVAIATAANLSDEQSQAEFAFAIARHLTSRGAEFQFRVQAMPLRKTATTLAKQLAKQQ